MPRPSSVVIESLERRELLSSPVSVGNTYIGYIPRKTVPHYDGVAIDYPVRLEIDYQNPHGWIYGTVDARFTKHGAETYDFVSRVVNGRFDVAIAGQPVSLEAEITTYVSQVPGHGVKVAAITGTGTIAGRSGSIMLVPSIQD